MTSGFKVVAQEALRASLAGQMALDAKKRRIASGWGDIRLGPVKMDLSTQLNIEAQDNVLYQETNEKSDLIFYPSVTVRTLYPVTDKNLLTFGAGVGYAFYGDNSDLNYLFLTPDSDLSFDVYAGDFIINFHDRFHFTQEVASQPSISGRGSYGRFDNSLGTLVTWDLNKALLQFNYDHLIYFATDEYYKYTDHTSELFGLRSAWLITPVTPLGLEFGFGTTAYEQDLLNDMVHYSFGAFYEMPAGKFTSVRLAAGYVIYEPTTDKNPFLSPDSTTAIYADLSFEHRLTQRISYTLTAGQQMRAGYYGQTLEYLYARASINWNVIRGYNLGTSFGYENGEEAGRVLGGDNEQFDRFYGGISIYKRLGEKLATSLGYYRYQRDSNFRGLGYTQNRLVLNVSYSF